MSAKCSNFNDFLPLIQQQFELDGSSTKENFRKFLQDYFENPSSIYTQFVGGALASAPSTNSSVAPEAVSSRTGLKAIDEDVSIDALYIGNSTEQHKMEREFTSKMIESCIFDKDTGEFVDANAIVDGQSQLNNKILKYKAELLKRVANAIGEDFDLYSIPTEQRMQKTNELLAKFLSNYEGLEKNDLYNDAYNAFVTFKYFDDLIAKFTPFIKINPKYKNNPFSDDRYEYTGPNTKHYTGFSTNEYADAKDNASDLVKILLDYFPQVNAKGDDIVGTSIGFDPFMSTINKVKEWMLENPDTTIVGTNISIYQELQQGTNMNFGAILQTYLSKLMSGNIKDPRFTTTNVDHLRGIIKYLYSPKMSDGIKQMFTHLMEKTVNSSYRTYSINTIKSNSQKEVVTKNLTERPVQVQRMFLEDVILGTSAYWSSDIKGIDGQSNIYRLNELLKKYNITIDGENDLITFHRPGKTPITVSSSNGFAITNATTYDNLEELVSDITNLVLPTDVDNIVTNLFSRNGSSAQYYLPLVASIIHNAFFHSNMTPSYKVKNGLAKILNIAYGTDTRAVIKNSEGNNLPLYQMVSLAYIHKAMKDRIKEQFDNESENPYNDNVCYTNSKFIKKPQIRSEITVGTKTISADKVGDSDLQVIALVHDFYSGLVTTSSATEGVQEQGVCYFQPHCFADKSTQFVFGFDFNKTWNIAGYRVEPSKLFYQYMTEASKGNENEQLSKLTVDDIDPANDSSNIGKLLGLWYESYNSEINNVVDYIIHDYRSAGFDVKSIADIEEVLRTYGESAVKQEFKNHGVDFVEETHSSKGKFNETLKYLYTAFNDKQNFLNFVNANLNQFVNHLKPCWGNVQSQEVFANNFGYFRELTKGEEANPLATAYFIANGLFVQSFNRMMIGNVWCHPNKDKSVKDPTNPDYYTFGFASRWTSQVKRMVIWGATYHSYAQNLKYGVPANARMAVMEDMHSNVQNMSGQSDVTDSQDGSGRTSPYLARMQNTSLIDAAVSGDKKTIYHDVDARYGNPKLLKWAEYEMTNADRRSASTCDLELLFKKMHSDPINPIEYSGTLDNLYIKNYKTGECLKINEIYIDTNQETGKLEANVYYTPVDNNGNNIGEGFWQTQEINNIYDLQNAFGGCMAAEFDEDSRTLQYTEKNQDIVTKIICDSNNKENFIGWVVNKSAIKVGATNVNPESSWYNDSQLQTTTMSTKFGGVQMNADHYLDDAEVTESSQMISALEQNGYTHDIAYKIYGELGRLSEYAIKDYMSAVQNKDKDKLYQIFGKAIIEAFNTGSKDTIGLAQAFIKSAKKSMRDNKLTYNIPFSSASINGIFNSTVTSQLVKKAIRRKYDGISAVLRPGHNTMQYYEIDGKKILKQDLIRNERFKSELQKITPYYPSADAAFDALLNNWEVQSAAGTVLNPFLEEVNILRKPIDFEDTVVLYNPADGYRSIKIDNFQDYNFVRKYLPKFNGGDKVFRFTLGAKNLKGSDTRFIITDEAGVQQQKSIYDLDTVELLNTFIESSTSGANDWASLHGELTAYLSNKYGGLFRLSTTYEDIAIEMISKLQKVAESIYGEYYLESNLDQMFPKIKEVLRKDLKNFLNNLQDNVGNQIEFNGNLYQLTAQKVIPAEIAMGRMHAKELNLQKGDSISDIQDANFFYNRISGYYTNDLVGVDDLYDYVLYDGSGEKLYVKRRDKMNTEYGYEISPNYNYQSIDGKVWFDKKEICSSNGKQFGTYTDVSGNQYNICIVDSLDGFNELRNSKMFNSSEYNYTKDNYLWQMQERFGNTNIKWKGKLVNVSSEEEMKNARININDVLERLDYNQSENFINRIKEIANNKFNSFKKSLQFVGTRIPCQSQQSFAAMETVIFTDDDVNRVYLPAMITWLQGSDYDIDKQYIMGYEISKNGIIETDEDVPDYLKESSMKNRIMDDIFQIILNPKNQINLTTPVTTDRLKKLAENSQLGLESKHMTPYDPYCVFSMQTQNMVGKDVIGNVATAIKSFFGLSTVYNQNFKKLQEALENNDNEAITQWLNDYTFLYDDKRVTLANINNEWLDNFIKTTGLQNISEENRIKLYDVNDFLNNLDDQSMILGELLNAATDNAKELILKKINADATWVDVYTSSLIMGDRLSDIYDIMSDPEIIKITNGYQTSIFSDKINGRKYDYVASKLYQLQLLGGNEETIIKLQKLLNKLEVAEELRIMGKIFKINQGIPTNILDAYTYVSKIEKFIEYRQNFEVEKKIALLSSASDMKKGADNLFKATKDPKYKEISDKAAADIQALKVACKERENKYINFSLYHFINDTNYQENCISDYEEHKAAFNILRAIAEHPSFGSMFRALYINNQILDTLSVRNKLTNLILQQANPAEIKKIKGKTEEGDDYEFEKQVNKFNKIFNQDQLFALQNSVTDFLIKQWLTEQQVQIAIDAKKTFTLDNAQSFKLFIDYMENYLIPYLKINKNFKNNEFIKQLVIGSKNGQNFYRLPYNMMYIGSSRRTQTMYENALKGFNDIKGDILTGTNTSIGNLFYLYNLLKNKDRFGANTLTRIFEDMVASEQSDSLFINNFNEWIDRQNAENLLLKYQEEFPDGDKENKSLVHWKGDVFNWINNIWMDKWCTKEGWNELHFQQKVLPRIHEAFQFEYRVSEDQSSPVAFTGKMDFDYGNDKLPYLKAKSTIEAIILGERTATTRYVSDGNANYWANLKVGDRIKFTNSKTGQSIIVECTKSPNWLIPRVKTRYKQPLNPSECKNITIGIKTVKDITTQLNANIGVENVELNYENSSDIENSQKAFKYANYNLQIQDAGVYAKQNKPRIIESYLVANNSDAVYVIGKIDGKHVTGNAQVATQMAKDFRKPLAAFDLYTNTWYQWDYLNGTWTNIDSPVFTKNFGIVCYEKVNDNIKIVLNNLFSKTFNANEYTEVKPDDASKPKLDDSVETGTEVFDETDEKFDAEDSKQNQKEDDSSSEKNKKNYNPFNSDNLDESERQKWADMLNDEIDFIEPGFVDFDGLFDGITWRIHMKSGGIIEATMDSTINIYDMTFRWNKFLSSMPRFSIDGMNYLIEQYLYYNPDALKISETEANKSPDPQWVRKVVNRLNEFIQWKPGMSSTYTKTLVLDNINSIAEDITSKRLTYKEKWLKLIESGLFDNIWSNSNGREVIVANIGNVKVLFYKSSSGTDGKVKGNWYPIFGFGAGKRSGANADTSDNNWLIKGTIEQMERGYGIPELKAIQNLLNNLFPWNPGDMHYRSEHVVFGNSFGPAYLNHLVLGKNDSGVQNGVNAQAHINNYLSKIHKEIAKLNGEEKTVESKYPGTKPSASAELMAKVKSLNNPRVKIISDSDFDHLEELADSNMLARIAKGFIKNGIIYINSDKATDDTVLHEFTHIYLAGAKLNNTERYYEILDMIRDTDIWKSMRKWKDYENKQGSDFDEEVLATIMSENDPRYSDFIGAVRDILPPEYTQIMSEDVLPRLDGVFFDNYYESQKIATVKNRLYKENVIKENCK